MHLLHLTNLSQKRLRALSEPVSGSEEEVEETEDEETGKVSSDVD